VGPAPARAVRIGRQHKRLTLHDPLVPIGAAKRDQLRISHHIKVADPILGADVEEGRMSRIHGYLEARVIVEAHWDRELLKKSHKLRWGESARGKGYIHTSP
jgi:hypothetical protein